MKGYSRPKYYSIELHTVKGSLFESVVEILAGNKLLVSQKVINIGEKNAEQFAAQNLIRSINKENKVLKAIGQPQGNNYLKIINKFCRDNCIIAPVFSQPQLVTSFSEIHYEITYSFMLLGENFSEKILSNSHKQVKKNAARKLYKQICLFMKMN